MKYFIFSYTSSLPPNCILSLKLHWKLYSLYAIVVCYIHKTSVDSIAISVFVVIWLSLANIRSKPKNQSSRQLVCLTCGLRYNNWNASMIITKVCSRVHASLDVSQSETERKHPFRLRLTICRPMGSFVIFHRIHFRHQFAVV